MEVSFDEMLDSFVPGEDPGDAPFAKLFNDIPQGEGKEKDMYNALVRTSYICPQPVLMFGPVSSR